MLYCVNMKQVICLRVYNNLLQVLYEGKNPTVIIPVVAHGLEII